MNNAIIFDLSKEHPVLAHDEIISCLRSEKNDFQIISHTEDALIVMSGLTKNQLNTLSQRIAMSFSYGEFLFESAPSVETIKTTAKQHQLSCKGTLAVRYKNRSSLHRSKPFVQAVADVYTLSREVDLNNPDNIINVLITNELVYVSLQIQEINRGAFETRKAHLRPFFSPISLHPKIARALINLAEVKPGGTILDPFCGTGGLLIEAGLIGLNVIGSDISEKMVNGAQKNLERYHIMPQAMITCDIQDIFSYLSEPVDAVITDFPYGKSTSTQGEKIQKLYHRAFKQIERLVKADGRVIVGTSSEEINGFESDQLTHVVSYSLPMHRSLTRWFHVFERKP